MKKILVINPGSTSTKIAVYHDAEAVFAHTVRHNAEEPASFAEVAGRHRFRKQLVLRELEAARIPFAFDAVIGRGGLVKPIPSGVYEVSDALRHDLLHASRFHASNLGGLIAGELASLLPGCRAFIADPVVVDELEDIARISGSPLLPRASIFHALNHKAVARRYAREHGVRYEALNLIVCHLGGGISVAAHRRGRIVDVNNALDGEGPFAPERAGTLPAGDLIDLCFSGRFTRDELRNQLTGRAGLAAHLGTTDVPAILERIRQNDEHAGLIIDAMVYNVAKAIGSQATVLQGKIDAIILTGGMAHSDGIISKLKPYISFLSEIEVYPGEDEMEALAMNASGALSGELPIMEYK
ncbi:MAG: butyrate kinase [Mediterranea sp.]|jgi:butyrate kinase|nr:butyrate kinase [Mediterranea sp.]